MTAAMLHLVAHAAFKSLGFLAAGSVLAATGLRDLDRLGGLARRMPATTVLFGVAALGASGLPLGAGFVSEWLLLQSLIHAARRRHAGGADGAAGGRRGRPHHRPGCGGDGQGVRHRLPRPSALRAGRDAREAPVTMLAGMTLAAAACVVLAVAPVVVAPALRRVLDCLPGQASRSPIRRRATAARRCRFDLAGRDRRGVGRRRAARRRLAQWRSRRRPEPREGCRCGHAAPMI